MEGSLVITMDHEAFKRLSYLIEQSCARTERLAQEIKDLKSDRWMSLEEVIKYIGFSYSWLYQRRNHIGCFQDGKELRFKKSHVDAYMEKYSYKINKN